MAPLTEQDDTAAVTATDPAADAPVGETGEVPAVIDTTEPLPDPTAEPVTSPTADTTDDPTATPEAGTTVPTAEPAAEPAPVAIDAACAGAVDLARAVAVEAGGAAVGDYIGVEADEALVVTHSFATTDPAYLGWRWAVTVTRADGHDEITVDEVVLLPGTGALLAPAWVPWNERVQPGDLSPGDLLPPPVDDPRVVPAYTESELDLAAETFWELGLGRASVLSAEGRADAAERWYDGERGPHTAMARQAPGQCLDCAYRLPVGGGLRALFGVCANAFAPDDGQVVSLDHGCGAHSAVPQQLTHVAGAGLVVEHEELEVTSPPPSEAVDELVDEAVDGAVDAETPDGHAS